MKQSTRHTVEQFKRCLTEANWNADESLLVKDFAPEIQQSGDRVVQFVISTGSVDRDGDTIEPTGWDLASFQKAGAILWGHDSYSPPIAESLGVWVEDNKLKAKCRFPTREVYEFSDTIYQLILNNVIRSTSVGFRPKTWQETTERVGNWGMPALDFKTQELLEYSVVSVPANPEALVEAKSRGVNMGPYLQWAEKTLDVMAESGLLVPRNDIERAYFAIKGSTSAAVPDAIGKAGRVLSTKNLDRLTSAMESIQEVIDSAGTVEDDEAAADKGADPQPVVKNVDPPVDADDDDSIGVDDLKTFFEPKKNDDEISLDAIGGMISDMVDEALDRARGR